MSAVSFSAPFGRDEAFARIRVLLEYAGYHLESTHDRLWFSFYRRGKLIRTVSIDIQGEESPVVVRISSKVRTMFALPSTHDIQMVKDWVEVDTPPFPGLQWPNPPFPPFSSYLSPYPRLEHLIPEPELEPASALDQLNRPVTYPLISSRQTERFDAQRSASIVWSRIRAFAHALGYEQVASSGGLQFSRGTEAGRISNPNILNWTSTLNVSVRTYGVGTCHVTLDRTVWAELHPKHIAGLTPLLEMEMKDMRAYVAILSEAHDIPAIFSQVSLEPYDARKDLFKKRFCWALAPLIVAAGFVFTVNAQFPFLFHALFGAGALVMYGERTTCVSAPVLKTTGLWLPDPKPFENQPLPPDSTV